MSSAIGINHAYASATDQSRIVALLGYTTPDKGWLRLTPEWRSSRDYSSHKAQVDSAHSKGLLVLVTGLGDFQNTGGHSMPLTDAQFGQYEQYMEDLIACGADALSPWNEPNHPNFGGANGTVAQDAKMQANLWWAKSVKGYTGTVFTSGLSPMGDNTDIQNLRAPYNWWTALCNTTGWADQFHVLDAHGYAYSNNNTLLNTTDAFNTAIQQAKIQDILKMSGRDRKLAWSEYGAPSQGDISAGQPGPINATTATQLKNFQDAHALWRAWETAGRSLFGKFAHKDNDDAYDKDKNGVARNMGLVDCTTCIWRPASAEFTAEAARVH